MATPSEMRAAHVAALLAVAFAGSGCGESAATAPVVKTTSAEISSVARYATYTYAVAEEAPQGYARGRLRPELVEEVQREVDAELARKGYTRADDGALVVRISTGSRTVEAEPAGRLAATSPGIEKTEGALVIDLIDRGSGEQLFHGYAHDGIGGDEVDHAELKKAVSKILEPLPRRTR